MKWGFCIVHGVVGRFFLLFAKDKGIKESNLTLDFQKSFEQKKTYPFLFYIQARENHTN